MSKRITRKIIGLTLVILIFSVTPAVAEVGIKPLNNQDYLATLLDLIDSSKTTVKIIALAFYTDNPTGNLILSSLKKAHRRGVNIQVFLEGDKTSITKRNQETYRKLQRLGIDTKLDSDNIVTHSKLVIVDDTLCLVGSTNLSANSLKNNNESNVLIRSKEVGKILATYFNELWTRPEQSCSLKSELIDRKIEVFTDQTYFETVSRLLTEAKEEIRIIMYYFAFDPSRPKSHVSQLFYRLVGAHNRGVKVKLFLEKSSYHKYLNQQSMDSVAFLRKNGIKEIVYDTVGQITHSKVIIVDGKIVVIGSTNWYWKGIDKHHQTNVVIHDKKIVDSFLRCFNHLYQGN